MAIYEVHLPNGDVEEYEIDDSVSAEDVMSKIGGARGRLQTFQEENDPNINSATKKLAKDRGFFGSILPNAGETFDRLARGAKMLGAAATWNPEEWVKLRKEQDDINSLMAPLRKENPWGSMVGSTLPYLAASPSTGLAMTRGAGNIAGQFVPQAVKAAGSRAASIVPGMAANYAPTAAKIGEGFKVADALAVQAQNRALLTGAGSKAASILSDPIKQSALMGGVVGAIDPDDSALTGAATGAAGAGFMKTLTRPFSKKQIFLTKPQQEIVKEADELGYYLHPGMRTGDFRQAKLDRRMAENPTVSQLFENREIENNSLVSKLIAKKLGLPETNVIDADYLHEGFKHYGNIMNEVASRSKVKLNEDDILKIYDVIENYKKLPGTAKLANEWKQFLWKELGVKKITPVRFGDKVVNKVTLVGGNKTVTPVKMGPKYIDKTTWNFKSGELPGDLYQTISTRLREQIAPLLYTKEGGDKSLGRVLKEIQGILDDGLEKGAHKADVDLLKFARKGYAGLELVRKSTDANSGRVDLKKIYKNLTKDNVKKQYDRIRGDDLFAKLGRIGKLQQETKTKADLATQNVSRSILGESPKDVTGAYKAAAWGVGDTIPTDVIPQAIARRYLSRSGWPAATGFFPVINPKTSEILQKAFARSTMGEMPSGEPDESWMPDIKSLWE